MNSLSENQEYGQYLKNKLDEFELIKAFNEKKTEQIDGLSQINPECFVNAMRKLPDDSKFEFAKFAFYTNRTSSRQSK